MTQDKINMDSQLKSYEQRALFIPNRQPYLNKVFIETATFRLRDFIASYKASRFKFSLGTRRRVFFAKRNNPEFYMGILCKHQKLSGTA